jgi:hypothetical protein
MMVVMKDMKDGSGLTIRQMALSRKQNVTYPFGFLLLAICAFIKV